MNKETTTTITADLRYVGHAVSVRVEHDKGYTVPYEIKIRCYDYWFNDEDMDSLIAVLVAARRARKAAVS